MSEMQNCKRFPVILSLIHIYKASHSCPYSYFPQYNGTSDDGINANKPDGQAREFYDGLNSDVKEVFDAYGVKTYVEMLGTNNAPGDWYPMWSFSNNFTTDTPGGVAWTKIGELKHAELPKVVMAKDFDSAWDTYMDKYNACNPQDFLGELQTELDKRLEPVSYTHLDVYKRQDFRSGHMSAPLSDFGGTVYEKINMECH